MNGETSTAFALLGRTRCLVVTSCSWLNNGIEIGILLDLNAHFSKSLLLIYKF